MVMTQPEQQKCRLRLIPSSCHAEERSDVSIPCKIPSRRGFRVTSSWTNGEASESRFIARRFFGCCAPSEWHSLWQQRCCLFLHVI